MSDDSTTPQEPCTCEVCRFIRVMASRLPKLPEDPDDMADALSLVLLNPEVREAFKPVLRLFDGIGRPGRKRTARALAEMDATERALASLLLDYEIRDALKAMVRAADRGDV